MAAPRTKCPGHPEARLFRPGTWGNIHHEYRIDDVIRSIRMSYQVAPCRWACPTTSRLAHWCRGDTCFRLVAAHVTLTLLPVPHACLSLIPEVRLKLKKKEIWRACQMQLLVIRAQNHQHVCFDILGALNQDIALSATLQ